MNSCMNLMALRKPQEKRGFYHFYWILLDLAKMIYL